MLDDLHWADKPSLLLLQFLARELGPLRLLVLGSYRDVELGRQHPLEETLAELTRTQLCERILLRGLQAVDVARFIELTAGREPPAALVEAVYRETEGNPFFVSEVVRLLQSDGRLEDLERVASWSVEIPQGVRQVIGRRLSALSEEANRILTIASVIGREFELSVLARAADSAAGEVLERIEEAEDARIVVEMEGAAGRYRFSHALIRETLYDELRTTHRLRLHRRVAEVLESLAGSDESRLAELSHHFCEAATGGDVEKAVDYAVGQPSAPRRCSPTRKPPFTMTAPLALSKYASLRTTNGSATCCSHSVAHTRPRVQASRLARSSVAGSRSLAHWATPSASRTSSSR